MYLDLTCQFPFNYVRPVADFKTEKVESIASLASHFV